MQHQLYGYTYCGLIQFMEIKFPVFGLHISKCFNNREIQFDRKAG